MKYLKITLLGLKNIYNQYLAVSLISIQTKTLMKVKIMFNFVKQFKKKKCYNQK